MEKHFPDIVPARPRPPSRALGRDSPQRSFQVGAMPGFPLIRLVKDLQQKCVRGRKPVFSHRLFSLSGVTAQRRRPPPSPAARSGILGPARRQVNLGCPMQPLELGGFGPLPDKQAPMRPSQSPPRRTFGHSVFASCLFFPLLYLECSMSRAQRTQLALGEQA